MKKFAIAILIAILAAAGVVYFILGRMPGSVKRDKDYQHSENNEIGIIPPQEVNQNNKKAPGSGKVNPVDKAEMVKVPAGEFPMGASNKDTDAKDNEKPAKTIWLDEYYIYKNEVTIGQYEKFIAATGYFTGDEWKKLIPKKKKNKKGVDFYLENVESDDYNPNMPVVNIRWEDALAYCRWAGVMLPTEAQWEKACRGKTQVIYPWGDKALVNNLNCIDNKNIPANEMLILKDGKGITHIGLFHKGGSRTGANDMAGNAAEWCLDFYQPAYYKTISPKNPAGPDEGKTRVVKGGSWQNHIKDCRVSAREGREPGEVYLDVGFRGVLQETPVKIKGEIKNKETKLPEIKKNTKDKAVMILIPEGEFTMGSNNKSADSDEKPQGKIKLDSYYIYKYEVTNLQFNRFISETGYQAEGDWKLLYNNFTKNHPVAEVSYNDAAAYAKWAGGRLPTEAEWEKAARGKDGRLYPWGNRWNPEYCNGKEMKSKRKDVAKLEKFNNVWYGTLPVGSFPQGKSPYGIMDMSGNVAEWCKDWYRDDYFTKGINKNPQGPDDGEERVLKGGSFFEEKNNMRCSSRDDDDPEKWCNLYGFRVVIPVKEGKVQK